MKEQLFVIPDDNGGPLLAESRRIGDRLEENGDSRIEVVAITLDGIHESDQIDLTLADQHVVLKRETGEFESSTTSKTTRTEALSKVIEEKNPTGILLPSTPDTDEVASQLGPAVNGSTLLKSFIQVKKGEIFGARPVYSQRAFATYKIESLPFIATIPTDGLPKPTDETGKSPIQETITVAPDSEKDRIKRLQTVDIPESDLSKAKVVVAGGDGIEGPDEFEIIHELADSLNATVGASRPPVDEGWVNHDRQIGVTGKSINADLYIPVAISGDPYHMDDVDATHILPINTDSEARIFEFADLGIVGDYADFWGQIAHAIRNKRKEDDRPSMASTGGGDK